MSGGSSPLFDDQAQSAGDFDDNELSIESSRLNVERRLTTSEKLQRGGMAVLAVVVTAFFLLGGPASISSWLGSLRISLNQSAPAINAAPSLGNVAPKELPMPPGVENSLTMRIGPANGPDGYIYSCGIQLQLTTQAVIHSFRVAIWTKTTRAWVQVPAPVATASTCAVVPDRERETGVLLAVWPAIEAPANTCLLPQLFHSDDAGEFWSAIPWPTQIQPTCDPQFFLEAGRLYVESGTPLLPPGLLALTSAAGFLLTTNTDAIFWRPADIGQANDTAFRLIALRANGKLLAESLQGTVKSYQSGLLWESTDAGEHWDVSAPLPGNAPLVSVSSNPAATDHGGWGYIYVNYSTDGAVPKPALGYGMLDTPGASWLPLPLPQNTGTLPGGPMSVFLPDAGEGPLESLIYLRSQDTTTRTLSPLYLPWLWDTVGKVWRLDPVVLPANSVPQGVSWQNGTMTIIVSVIHQGVEPVFQTFSFTLTPHDLD